MDKPLQASSSNCTQYNTTDYLYVAGVRALSGFISLLASLLVVIMIFVFRKYNFFVQRLILYLSIASVFNGISKTLQGRPPAVDWYCEITAFFDQQSDWSVFLATLVIAIHIYIKAVHNRTVKLELLCILIIFIAPLSFNWIPFIHRTYGPAGPWCWINQYKNNTTCQRNNLGFYTRMMLWFIPSNLIIFVIFVLYVIIFVSLRREKHQYKAKYCPQQELHLKMKIEEIKPLIVYPVILVCVTIPAIVARFVEIITSHDGVLWLWFLQAFFTPLQGGLVCLAYALDPETRRRLRRCSCGSLCCRNRPVRDYPAVKGCSDSMTDDEKQLLINSRSSTCITESTFS